MLQQAQQRQAFDGRDVAGKVDHSIVLAGGSRFGIGRTLLGRLSILGVVPAVAVGLRGLFLFDLFSGGRLLVLLVLDLFEEGLDARGEAERRGGILEHLVDLLRCFAGGAQDARLLDALHEIAPRRHLFLEPEAVCESHILLVLCGKDSGAHRFFALGDGDGRHDHGGCHALPLLRAELQDAGGEGVAFFECVGVEQVVPRLPEDLREAVKVGQHKLFRPDSTRRDRLAVVSDVFDSGVGLLPELQFGRDLELHNTGIEVRGLRLRELEIERVVIAPTPVLDEILPVSAQLVAQLSKFGFAFELDAKREGSAHGLVVLLEEHLPFHLVEKGRVRLHRVF